MTYKECLDYIRSDYYRIRGEKVGILKMLLTTAMEEGFRFLFGLDFQIATIFSWGE